MPGPEWPSRFLVWAGICLLSATPAAFASDLDTLGVTLLRQVDATLTGQGSTVAQPEASGGGSPPAFEVNPAAAGQPVGLFTYTSSNGTATTFPNSVGTESGHADSVGYNFYGLGSGMAPGVARVDNYDADYFYNSIIAALLPPAIGDPLVNQSFIFTGLTSSQEATVDQNYDNYAANNNILFFSGAGNGGSVYPPATCYNGMGVGVYGASSSVGPTSDGRSKPDITAPGGATSFSTPYVAGAGAVLLQAAVRGDGGPDVAGAEDMRTLKALLLNGAVKPGDWTNGVTTPLDARYGAGILNVFESWKLLSGGRHSYIESTSNTSGSPHPPGSNTNNEPVPAGWDFNSITNQRSLFTYKEQVNHYYFNLNTNAGSTFMLTATLVWNRQAHQTAVNNLNLFLYNVTTTNLVISSTSAVDNVQHIFLPALPKGRYDLQVQKNPASQVSASETYALVFEFANTSVTVTRANSGVVLSWPIFPVAFALQSATNLTPPISWSAVSATPVVTNNQNVVILPNSVPDQFFRLVR